MLMWDLQCRKMHYMCANGCKYLTDTACSPIFGNVAYLFLWKLNASYKKDRTLQCCEIYHSSARRILDQIISIADTVNDTYSNSL